MSSPDADRVPPRFGRAATAAAASAGEGAMKRRSEGQRGHAPPARSPEGAPATDLTTVVRGREAMVALRRQLRCASRPELEAVSASADGWELCLALGPTE